MSDDLIRIISPVDEGGDPTGATTAVPDGVASRPSAADLARYAAVAAAADDPERVLGPATDAFRDLHDLVHAGDRVAAAGAAIMVQDLCLQTGVTLAGSATAAENKVRFLAILQGWAWPRAPAVGAVLEASRAQELRRWSLSSGKV